MPIESVSLLAALFFLPGAESLQPMDVGFDVAGIVIDESVGEGKALDAGGLATFHYEIVDGNGKVLASSERRGLLYTGSPSGAGPDSALLGTLVGVRAGGRRRILTDADALGVAGDFLIPAGTPLEVRVHVLSVGAYQNPVVESRGW